jgi:hypothetical protein
MPGLAKVQQSVITEACDCFVSVPTVTTTISATETATDYLRQLLDVTTTTSTTTLTTSAPLAVATDLVGFSLVDYFAGSACIGDIVDVGPGFNYGSSVNYDLGDSDPSDATTALAYCAYYCLNEGQTSTLRPANVPVPGCQSFLLQYWPDGNPGFVPSGGWECTTYFLNAI